MTDQKITLHATITNELSPLDAEQHFIEIDLTNQENLHAFATLIEWPPDMISGDFLITKASNHETANDARKEAGQFHAYINKGKAKKQAIAKAQEKVDSTLADLTAAVLDADTDRILAINDELTKAKKALTKAQAGRSGNGNGDRSNPLPDIEVTNYATKGKNGSIVFIWRSDICVETGLKKDDPLIPGHWYAGITDPDTKKYRNWGSLGECEEMSWSGIGGAVNQRVNENPGSSNGTGGLSVISDINAKLAIEEMGFTLKSE